MAFSVLPIIDLQTGQVQLKVQGRWYTRYISDPAQLERLITRSAHRPVFDLDTGELIILVASAGLPAGKPVAFRLAKFPASLALAKVRG